MFETDSKCLISFDTKHQVEFLVKHWTTVNSTLQHEQVSQFARRFLTEIKAVELNTGIDVIIDTPLHCQIIAELYQYYVDQCFDEDNFISKPSLDFDISNFYFELTKRKFEIGIEKHNLINWTIDEFYKIHANQAMIIFATELGHKLIPHQFEERTVESLNYFDVADFDEGKVQFNYHTFAEYFLAWFIFNGRNTDEVLKLMVTQVLQIHDPNNIRENWDAPNLHDIKKQLTFTNFGVSYFLNYFLTEVDYILEDNVSPNLRNYDSYLLTKCVSICLHKNLWHILKLWGMSHFSSLYSIENQGSAEHLFNTVEYCDQEAIELGLEAFKTENQILNLDKVIFLNETVLHVAARRGNFTVFDYVFNHGNFSSFINSDNHTLLHACVVNSYHLNDHVIEGKIEIMEYLHKKNTSCIHQKNDKGLVPFLIRNIHPKLLSTFIKIKSNLLEAPKGESILHVHTTLNPEEYNNLIDEISTEVLTQLLQTHGINNQTPLHRAVQNMKLLPSTLKKFISHQADPNCVDSNKESVIGTAIRNNRKLVLLEELKKAGSKLNYVNPKTRDTLFHVAAQVGNFEAIQFLLNQTDTKLVDELLYAANENDKSAAEVALLAPSPNQKAILETFISKGVRLSPQTLELATMNLDTFVNYKKYINVSYEDEYSTFVNIFTKFLSKQDRLDHQKFIATRDIFKIAKMNEKDRQQELVLKYIGNAISRGDCGALDIMLGFYHQPLAQIEMDFTLLHYAVKCGHFSVVQFLLRPKHFESCFNEPRMKNLIHSCVAETASEPPERISDKKNIIQKLCSLKAKLVLEAGKNIPVIETPQALLIPNVHATLLKCLIDNGADIWATELGNENSKFCFLHRAACLPPEQFHDVLKFLDPADAKLLLTFETSTGLTPVHYALQQTVEVTGEEEYLSEHIPTETPDKTLNLLQNLGVKFNSSHIDTATRIGHSKVFIQKLENLVMCGQDRRNELVKFDPVNRSYVTDLIGLGVNLNAKDKNGCAPIHNVFRMATNLSFADVGVDLVRQKVIELIQHGADVNIADATGHTALHLTVINQPEKFMTLLGELVAAGGDITAVDKEQRNLLHLASIHYVLDTFHEVVSYILSVNPKLIEGRDIYGCSPLHYAMLPISKQNQAEVGEFPTLQLFFDYKVDINAIDCDGNSVLMYAVSAIEDVDTSFMVNPLKQPNATEALIKKRTNLYQKNNNYVTVLHVAAYKGNIDIIEYLLSVGLRDNPSDIEGNTPLHWAFIDMKDANRLMGSHMHKRTQQLYNKSQGSSFFRKSSRPLVERLRALLKYKPDVNCRNIHNETPMQLAEKRGLLKRDVHKELEKHGAEMNVTTLNVKPIWGELKYSE